MLIVGSGGREHALAWKMRQSDLVDSIYVAPGNGGTAEFNAPIKADDVTGLIEFAKKHHCFTVVGPEGPLALGIVDRFTEQGLEIFGPTKKEAMLETSKSYAKEFMKSIGIPTADFEVFEDSSQAINYAHWLNGEVVVKADGLAGGKGVIVCSSVNEAEQAIRSILDQQTFGDAGKKIVVEEKLRGTECSLMTICNGKSAIPFGTAKDHKRVFDNDSGPNTGGMGAFSPAENLTSKDVTDIVKRFAVPAVRASNFRGFLYLGLMLTDKGPKVLEFNARLGDPETQAILPRLKSDLFETLTHVESGISLDWDDSSACTVLMCSEGYPQNPRTGDLITGIDTAEKMQNLMVFHSGTQRRGDDYFTSGGRVLSVTGIGRSLSEAAQRAYAGVSKISWKGEHHRKDIGTVK